MPGDVVSNLISAGAGLVGAIVGAGATLLGGVLQGRREVRNEAAREARKRAIQAAEECLELFDRFTRALESASDRRDAEAGSGALVVEWVDVDVDDLNGSLLAKGVYLPGEVRHRVELARVAMVFAGEIARGGYHYLPMSTIVRYSAHSVRTVLVAFICNEEIPAIPLRTRELSVAVEEMTVAVNSTRERKEHLEEFEKTRLDFKMAHPDIYSSEEKQRPRWQRLLRLDESKPG